MCKHVLNAQVSIRTSCCKRWVDCPKCHDEVADHPILKTHEMILACKKCKKVWRLDPSVMEEADEYCPYCDNHFVIPAITPPERRAVLQVEGSEEMIDPRLPRRRPPSE